MKYVRNRSLYNLRVSYFYYLKKYDIIFGVIDYEWTVYECISSVDVYISILGVREPRKHTRLLFGTS
jgi:hypothetical protein